MYYGNVIPNTHIMIAGAPAMELYCPTSLVGHKWQEYTDFLRKYGPLYKLCRHFPRKGFVGPPPSSKVCKTFSIIFLIILSRNLSSSKVCKTHGLVWSWTSPGAASQRLRLHAPATPRAQSECIARFARTFSIGTPRATSPRGCFEGLLWTIRVLHTFSFAHFWGGAYKYVNFRDKLVYNCFSI